MRLKLHLGKNSSGALRSAQSAVEALTFTWKQGNITHLGAGFGKHQFMCLIYTENHLH